MTVLFAEYRSVPKNLDHFSFRPRKAFLRGEQYSGLEAVAQRRNMFGRGQSITSSVTEVVLSPTVPFVYFITVEN